MNSVEQLYSCVCGSHGECVLSVSIKTDASKAKGVLLDVMLLNVFENLTQSLEDILLQSLEWQRSNQIDTPSTSDMLELTLEFESQATIESASLHVPALLLTFISEHQIAQPETVTRMSWQRVLCTLCLSELKLSEDEKKNLHDGALLVIPESFLPTWKSSLRIGKTTQLMGKYSLAEDAWFGEKAAVAETTKTDGNTARMQAARVDDMSDVEQQGTHRVEFSCRLDPSDLMCAHNNPVNIGLSEGQYSAQLLLQGNECAEFHGSLIPVGSGQAMVLTQGDAPAVIP